ncbi:MAG: DUF4157 domain-containing protein [Bacteroidetes bacterium]|nr:DUF4157 domain-containing protein [Bacteroidota bacterium]
MKATESKPASTIAKNESPFFSKSGEEGFFNSPEKENFFLKKPGIQTKLTVGAPDDPYERQADSMADKVVQRSTEKNFDTARNSSASFLQLKCASCEEEERLQKKDEEDSGSAMDKLLRKPIFDSNAEPDEEEKKLQRKCKSCDEEEKLQKKSDGSAQTASPHIESSLQSSKGSGSALPNDTRHEMESSFGTDFSGVRIHNDGIAADMNRDLHAQAFTHGSDIYFNAGNYDTDSNAGKHLLAHELTHVVQQNGSDIQKQPQPANDYLKTNQSRIQRLDVPFTGGEYEFDISISGAETAVGLAGEKVKEGAVWVKDRAVDAFKWIFDKIMGLLNSGYEWLKDKFKEIENFASTVLDKIKSTLKNALGNITNPLELVTGAMKNMDAGILKTAWNALTSGANLLWQIVKGTINGLMDIASGIWNAVSGFVDTLFDTVEGLMDNWAFRQLPGFMQDAVRGLYDTVHSFWITIRDFWKKFWDEFTSFVHDLLESIERFVKRVIDFAIDTIIKMVQTLKEVYDFVSLLVKDPEAALKPVLDGIASKIIAEAPAKTREKKDEKMQEALSRASASSSSVSGGIIQRAPEEKVERSRASRDEVNNALEDLIGQQLSALDIRSMLWDTVVNMFWPPATIKAIGNEFYEMWNTDWAEAVDNLHSPRSILDDFGGFFADLWDNFLILLDFPLALWRRLNNVLMLLMGYVTILLILIGTIGGAIFGGGVPGALAGAAAGAELSWAIGEALFWSFIFAESASVLKAFLELFTSRQTERQKQRDYMQIVASTIGMGIAAVIALIFMLLGALVKMVVGKIKGANVLPPKPEPKRLGSGEAPKQDPPKTNPPKEEQKTEPPKTDPPKEETKTEPPKEDPNKNVPTDEKKTDQPKDEPKTDTPKDEPKTDKPIEKPKEQPKTDPPKEDPKTTPPQEDPKLKPPTDEPKVQPPSDEPKVEPPVDEPKVQPPSEEPKVNPPSEEPKVEPPSNEPKVQPPTEEPKVEPPKKEPKKGKSKEPVKKYTPEELKTLSVDELVKQGEKQRQGETGDQAKQRIEEAKAEAKRRGYCFVAGTIVQTPDGPICIEHLVPGQKVFAKKENQSLHNYSVIECMQDSTDTLYHLQLGGAYEIVTTRNHPIFSVGKGWTQAKDLKVGDSLISLCEHTITLTNIYREKLAEPVNTYNLHIEEAHNYFVGDGADSIWVHNATPGLNDGVYNTEILWGFTPNGPKPRMPKPDDAGDVDGASAWRTKNIDEAGRLLGVRKNIENADGNHGAITEAQLAEKGLIAVDTPGRGPLAEKGFKHVSIRPKGNPDPNVPLTEEELTDVANKLKEITPEAKAKGADFLC